MNETPGSGGYISHVHRTVFHPDGLGSGGFRLVRLEGSGPVFCGAPKVPGGASSLKLKGLDSDLGAKPPLVPSYNRHWAKGENSQPLKK